VPQSYYFCIKNAQKLTYEHLYFKKILGSLSLAMRGRENKRRKGREGKGKGREAKREGQGATAPKFGTLSTPLGQ
jgi:hypothetical protein